MTPAEELLLNIFAEPTCRHGVKAESLGEAMDACLICKPELDAPQEPNSRIKRHATSAHRVTHNP